MYKRIFCLILCLMMLPLAACAPKMDKNWFDNVCITYPSPQQLVTAKVPRQVPYPDTDSFSTQAELDTALKDWRAQNKERRQAAESADHPTQFYLDATATLLTESEGNAVYSPLNLPCAGAFE